MDINKSQEKMDDEAIEAAKERSNGADINSVEDGWYLSQPEACYRADGWVASMDLLSGNHQAVEQNYRNNLDLDAQLAQTFGHSALIQGNTELAHEAYRQAIKLENGYIERANNRLALALVYADQGKWEQANDLFQESLELTDDPMTTFLWVDNMVNNIGEESSRAVLTQWSESHPDKQSGPLGLLRLSTPKSTQQTTSSNPILEATENTASSDTEWDLFGDKDDDSTAEENLLSDITTIEDNPAETPTKSLEAVSVSEDWISHKIRTLNNPLEKSATQILGYTYSGEIEKAGALLDNVKGHIHASASLSFAAANYYAAAGKSEEASNALKQTVALAPYMSGYALTLRK
jgi:tetratricopeptide (TPR) repeat protein